MKKKLAIFVLFFFIIIYFLSSCSFAYTDTTVQQDLYYYAYQDTLVVQNLFQRSSIHSAVDLLTFINENYPNAGVVANNLLYFAILHRNAYQYDLVFYNDTSLSSSTIVNDYEYFGIITQGFTISNCVVVRLGASVSQTTDFIYGVSKVNSLTVPSIYYKNSREILFSHV